MKATWRGILIGGALIALFSLPALRAALVPLLRLALPLVVGYLAVRWVKTQLLALTGGSMNATGKHHSPYSGRGRRSAAQQSSTQTSTGTKGQEVIDICPDCGELLNSRQCCKSRS